MSKEVGKRKYFRKNVQLSLTQIQFYSRLFIKNQLKATVISGHFYCKIYQFEPNDSLWASTIYKAESEPSNSQNAMNLKGVSLSDSRARYNNSLKYKKKNILAKRTYWIYSWKCFSFPFPTMYRHIFSIQWEVQDTEAFTVQSALELN